MEEATPVPNGTFGRGRWEVALREEILPIDGQLSYKGFGEYFEDRFSGYHVAIDLEAPADTPVYAVDDGEVVYSGWVSGYGGVMVVRTIMSGRTLLFVHGHLDPSSLRAIGASVAQGEQLAVLGEEGEETDGEREHLHFAAYEGEDVRLKGYEASEEAVEDWLNPYDYVRPDIIVRSSSSLAYDGRDVFPLEFNVPAGWDVEYIPSIQSLNLYSLSGEGTARKRSQILIASHKRASSSARPSEAKQTRVHTPQLGSREKGRAERAPLAELAPRYIPLIRYFDASSFLTLSTVTIYSTTDLTVGTGDYAARRYDIKKNPDVADFVDQPPWRNERHVVTDFRRTDGYTRYFVVAANPELDETVYESLLASMSIK